MKPEDFDWKGGRVTHWTLNADENVPIQSSLDELVEDLVQVHFGTDTILDVGWYPECSIEGAFRIVVIQSMKWDKPVWASKCRNFLELRAKIPEAIDVALDQLIGMPLE